MRVLVTGATGMLGREVARALARRGDRVTVLQRRPAGLGLSEVLTDISNAEAVRTAASDQDAALRLALITAWESFTTSSGKSGRTGLTATEVLTELRQ